MVVETVVLGGGCFWCTEAIFKRVKGVISVEPGYAGGTTPHPTYDQVCRGTTGHAEVVRVVFDPKQVALDDLLEIFFQAHDPTSLNRQGDDQGTQYRSIILTTSPDQEYDVLDFISRAQQRFTKPIITEVHPLRGFYPAEDYHRDYYAKNKADPYCLLVIHPKLKKVQKAYPDRFR